MPTSWSPSPQKGCQYILLNQGIPVCAYLSMIPPSSFKYLRCISLDLKSLSSKLFVSVIPHEANTAYSAARLTRVLKVRLGKPPLYSFILGTAESVRSQHVTTGDFAACLARFLGLEPDKRGTRTTNTEQKNRMFLGICFILTYLWALYTVIPACPGWHLPTPTDWLKLA